MWCTVDKLKKLIKKEVTKIYIYDSNGNRNTLNELADKVRDLERGFNKIWPKVWETKDMINKMKQGNSMSKHEELIQWLEIWLPMELTAACNKMEVDFPLDIWQRVRDKSTEIATLLRKEK